jgi:hypothetical protein
MTSTAPQTRIDPLHAFMARASSSATPLPLIATHFDIHFDAGLAVVTTTRTFRNAEPNSIEATITFPVPVHAVLFALQARIGERVLRARAKRRDAARADYEGAIDRGKTAVLHEEVLRGVHMLSVAHIPPAAEVVIEFRWAMAATNIDGHCHLRIPLTVGDIYGPSGLIDSDELIHAGLDQDASLSVQCRDGTAMLRGRQLENGRARVALDTPIDLEMAGWTPRELHGRSADGREVALRIEPSAAGESALDVALIVDRSGSMAAHCTSTLALSKHMAVMLALDAMAKRLRPEDALDLWEFSDTCRHVGSTDGQSAGTTSPFLGFAHPAGGTEIGAALEAVIAGSNAPDIVLLTDGKSHALDVQSLARSGRRFTVVLIGEDSLEANVGHLAALSGGEIFIADGHDIAPALAASLRSLRARRLAPTGARGTVGNIMEARAGMRLTVRLGETPATVGETVEARAIAAVAASLMLPWLATEAAAKLAEAEGLVTHLTSLVLVDESGATQQSIPASRKVPLATPAAVGCAYAPAPMPCLSDSRPAARTAALTEAREEQELRGRRASDESSLAGNRSRAACGSRRPSFKGVARGVAGLFRRPFLERSGEDLSRIAKTSNWDFAPDRLQAGDLKGLGPAVQEAIRKAAAKSDVIALAAKLRLDPVVLVIALMAHAVASQNRSARRIARAILPGSLTDELKAVARGLGLG